MINKGKKTVMAIIAVVVVGGAIFYACQKENMQNDTTVSTNEKVVKELQVIRVFKTFEEMFEEINNVSEMDENQLQNYEQQINFCSFGRMSENIYFQIIEQDSMIDKKKALDYIAQHPQFLQLTTDEEGDLGFFPKFDVHPFRYIMNEFGLFQIGDTVYQVFTDAIVGAALADVSSLLNVKEGNLREAVQNPNFVVLGYNTKMQKGNYGQSFTKWQIAPNNSKERVKLVIECYPSPYGYKTLMDGRMVLRGEWRGNAKSNCWICCKRTLHANVNVLFSVDHVDVYGSAFYTSSKPEYNYEKKFFGYYVNKGNAYSFIKSANGTVSIPTSWMAVNCN